MKTTFTRTRLALLPALCLLAACAAPAWAQSLFRQPVQHPAAKGPDQFPGGAPAGPGVRGQTPETSNPAPQPAEQAPASNNTVSLKQASLMYVEPAKPRSYEIHDIVTIIISENSSQSSEQKLDAKKDAALKAAVNKFPDIALFLQGNLKNTSSTTPIAEMDLSGNSSYKGDGKFERYDKFTDRIAATVIDVKPNGVLVLEARKTVGQDKEVRTLVLSGQCRRDDVTESNTILSSQLADLTVEAHAEGDAKDTASKGFLTRLMEGIFNF
jgi:flagellar L-ring protein precursor FlgH